MEAMKIYNYNGQSITFQTGDKDVMVNATEMARPFGKLPAGWLRNQVTIEFLQHLSVMRNCITDDLVIVKTGGYDQGTWLHEDVALEFARWLSPAFAIWCNDRIKELLKTVTASLSTLDILELTIKGLPEQQVELDEIKSGVRQLKAATRTRPDYFTIVGWATIYNMHIGLQTAAKLGAKADRICRDRGYPMENIPDPRFGWVRMYPSMVLRQVFDDPI